MQLVTYQHGSKIKPGVLLKDWIVDLQLALDYLIETRGLPEGIEISGQRFPISMRELIDHDAPFMELARSTLDAIASSLPDAIQGLASEGILWHSDQVTLLPPVMNPGKLICVGMNYPSIGTARAQKPDYPVLFLKSASTLTGHGHPILLPKVSEQVLCEGELALVIGKQGKHIPVEKARAYIAGYTIANDLGARDLEQRTSQWATGKLPDTFCPMGPALVTPDQVPNLETLTIRTYINDKLMQSGNTGEMIFNIPYLISYISSIATLVPGDIILTGSPKMRDNQPAPMVSLNPGDQISIMIAGIGVLSNHTLLEEYPDA